MKTLPPHGFIEKPEVIYHETREREFIRHPLDTLPTGVTRHRAWELTQPLPKDWEKEGIENSLLAAVTQYELQEWKMRIWVPEGHTPERVLALEGRPVLHLYGHWRTHIFHVWVKEGETLQ